MEHKDNHGEIHLWLHGADSIHLWVHIPATWCLLVQSWRRKREMLLTSLQVCAQLVQCC